MKPPKMCLRVPKRFNKLLGRLPDYIYPNLKKNHFLGTYPLISVAAVLPAEKVPNPLNKKASTFIRSSRHTHGHIHSTRMHLTLSALQACHKNACVYVKVC